MSRYFSFKSLAVLAAVTFAAMYVFTAIPRILYPYDLDFIEDSMLMQSLRFAQGLPVFAAPSAEFVAHVYMPLYTWLGGWLLKLTGPGFVPLRLLSLSATLTTAAIIFYIARRESGFTWLGLASAGLYLGGYRLSGFWYELVRVDSLYVTLAITGAMLGVYSKSTKGILASAATLALAFFTKQTGLAFAVGVAAYLFLALGKRAALFVGAFVVIAVTPLITINLQTGGWFFHYVFSGASSNTVEIGRAFRYIAVELFGVMAGLSLMALIAALMIFRRIGSRAVREQPWLMMILVAVIVSGVGRSSVGGNLNNLMPAYAFLCLAPAISSREWREHLLPEWHTPVLATAIILQLALGVYNPLRYIPTAEMRQSGDRLIEKVRAIDGEVLVLMHPYYALLAGKEPAVQVALIWYEKQWQDVPFPKDFVERIQSQYYAAIISDETLFETDPDVQRLITTYYSPTGTLAASESPPAVTGMFARPTVIYTPKRP